MREPKEEVDEREVWSRRTWERNLHSKESYDRSREKRGMRCVLIG